MTRLGLAATLLLAASIAGCGETRSAGPQGPPPVAVEVATVERETLHDVVDFTGQLEAEESVVVQPETSGIIATVEFNEGEEVTHGRLLFRLRDDEQRARLGEAKASLLLAERVHNRAAALATEGVVSAEQLDRTRAELEKARAQVEVAEVALARTEIRAPFDGVLGRRFVSPGDYVRSGQGRDNEGSGLVEIDAVERLKLVFSVPEVAVPRMRVGAPLFVTVTPWPNQKFPGEVYFVAPALDPRNRRQLVQARLPNEARKLRPGLSATVHLEVERRDDALTVPESAIVYDAEGPFAWRVGDEDTAQPVRVEVGLRRGGRVEILAGLAAGERVVSAGTHKVSPDQPLRIRGDDAQAAAER